MGCGRVDSMTDDVVDDDFDEVIENVTMCSECEDYMEHEILKERKVGTGRDLLLKCKTCSAITNLQIREPKSVSVPFILTDGPNSVRVELEIDEDEEFVIGDVFEEGEMLWSINQIIDQEGRKKKKIIAPDASVISALRTDMVRVKITATRGEHSDSSSMLVDYGTKFTADTKIDYQGEVWRIRAIHTGAGRTLRGTVEAQDIKRIYLHEPPNPQHFEPKTPRERRQAWKEGRLGYNPNPEVPKEITKKRVTPSNKRKKKRPRK
tara:strand:+ start:1314 stop:2105 length:792 start_codon:yes stop_codon:yes gene_type:complete